eukprot:8866967-Ditylum_brightwellii.AAC.1
MREVSNKIRMWEKTLPMTYPLVDKLQHHGITEYSDQVILDTSSEVEGIEAATQALLNECNTVNSELPKEVELIPFAEFLCECKRLRERIASSPSTITPAMVKTEAEDLILGRTAWHFSNFIWCSGHSPTRFKMGLDLLIHKKAKDNWLDGLCPILLFDIKCNMHSKCLGRYGMSCGKIFGGIAPEQYCGCINHTPELQALNQRMFYNQVLLNRTPVTSTFIDLVSNYDLVVHSIALMAYQWAGVPKGPVYCTFSTLQDMVHTV